MNILPPLLVRIKIHGEKKFSLWLPLFLLWIVILPLLVITLPLLLIAGLLITNPKQRKIILKLPLFYPLITSLKGLEVDVKEKNQTVYVRIY